MDYEIAHLPARGGRPMARWSGWLNWPARLANSARSGPLAVRNFRLLSFGQSMSTVGDYCYAVALPWLVLSGHGGTVMLGTVLACYGVPRTVLIPAGGVLADKFGPRRVMLAADACRCVIVAVLAVLAARHIESLAVLGPTAALLGAGEGVFLPASFSIMPTLLPADQLPTGNAFATAMVRVGSLVGPMIGGLLVAPAGPAPAFAVDAMSFGASAVALAMIRVRGVPTSRLDAEGLGTGLRDGGRLDGAPGTWELLRRSCVLRIILAIAVAANLTAGGTFEVAMPTLAHAKYGASGYGALIACFGAGAVVGTLIGVRMGSLRRPFVVACCGFVLEAVVISTLPLLGGLVSAAMALMIAGACNGFGNIVLFTLLQQQSPARSLGRVMSLLMLAGIGTFPISVGIAGLLVRHMHPVAFFPVAGIVLGVAVLAALSRREMREFGAKTTRVDRRPAEGCQAAEDDRQAAVLVR